jgi:hypothetical protein
MSTGTGDALDFVQHALAALPRDPARCSLGDLERLASVEAGFTRHVQHLRDSMAELEEGTRGELDDASLREALRQRRDLHSAEARVLLAARRLERYTRSAMAAHGIDINPAAPTGGDDPRRTP